MVFGTDYFFIVRLLLLSCSLLAWVDARAVMQPSLEVGRRLREYHAQVQSVARTLPQRHKRPFEFGAGFYKEFDIIERIPRRGRNGLALIDSSNVRWPNAVVPYEIQGNFTTAEKSIIKAAIAQFAVKTCVRFIPHTTEDIFVTIDNSETGCWSYVGRSMDNVDNRVNLQSTECVKTFVVVHELMHVIGFFHEFVRPDRDSYISIDRSALKPEFQTDEFFESNFAKMPESAVVLYGRPYDYGSVLHYSKYAGSANPTKPVMNNLQPWNGDFGNEYGLSPSDIIEICYMYCNSTTTSACPAPKTTTSTTTKVTKTTTSTTTKVTKPTTSTTTKKTTTTKPKTVKTTTTKPVTTTSTTGKCTTKRPASATKPGYHGSWQFQTLDPRSPPHRNYRVPSHDHHHK
uniref:Metalloendopeptidase n=1 Tax=Anopheles farauti TaxID=69004 RepID=A0A182Q0I0_9DIPT